MDPDPDLVTASDPERRVEEAKQSMFARMEELGRRLQDAREKVDIKAHIAAHPQLAVGIAFGIGALLALPGSGKKRNKHVADSAEVKSGLIGAAMATLGSLVFSLLKDVAMKQAGGAAFDWWKNRQGADAMGTSEVQASRTRETETFFNR